MGELFAAYLQAGFFGSVIILLVMLLRVIMRKAPRQVLCFLWLLAAVRLLVPLNFESVLSLQPRVDHERIRDSVVVGFEAPEVLPEDTEPAAVPETQPEDTRQEQVPQARKNAAQQLPALWLLGMAAVFLYSAISYVYLKHKVREAVKDSDGILESTRIQGPFLLGYEKPRIYMPAGILAQDRRFIVAHEQAHILRGDNWWKLLGFLCGCVHWYNPLVWLGYTLLCRDIEIACDEKVVAGMDLETRKAYSVALLNCGKRLSGLSACPVAFGEVSLRQRIRNVLAYRRPDLWLTVAAIVLTVLVAVCFLTTPETNILGNAGQTLQQGPGDPVLPGKETTGPAEETTAQPADNTAAPQPEEATVPSEEEMTGIPDETGGTAPESSPVETAPTQGNSAATGKPAPPSTETTVPAAVPEEPEQDDPEVTPDADGIIASGTWNNGRIQWELTSDGILTFTGDLFLYESENYPWQAYSEYITRIEVSDGIIDIPSGAFRGFSNLTGVYLGSSVQTLGRGVFANCVSIQTVTLPAGISWLSAEVFRGCSSLRTVEFAPGCNLVSVGEYAFADSGIVKFAAPNGLRSIEENAFSGCTALQSVSLQGSVSTIESGAFSGCSGLQHIILGASVEKIADSFDGFTSLISVEIYTNTQLCTFKDCTSLSTVVIGGQMTEVEPFSFYGCSALSSVVIQAPIDEIGEYAFAYCSSLTLFKIPDEVKKINSGAFMGTGIIQITFPSAVKQILVGAFSNSALREIYFPGSAPEMITATAFDGVTATSYYPAGNATWTEDKLQNYGGNITWLPQ